MSFATSRLLPAIIAAPLLCFFLALNVQIAWSEPTRLLLQGWYYPHNANWISVRCDAKPGEDIPVARDQSPDLVKYFKDDAADHQRFNIEVPDYRSCRLHFADPTASDQDLAALAKTKPSFLSVGAGTLTIDVATFSETPAAATPSASLSLAPRALLPLAGLALCAALFIQGCRRRKTAMMVWGALLVVPVFTTLLSFSGLLLTDAQLLYGGISYGLSYGPGFPTIDPNVGSTSQALGVKAASDLLSGHLPLWNHLEGLGQPLLGEMQSAALFPTTLLLLLPHGQMIEFAVLQLFAGWGAYLFFKKFGLCGIAALSGGLLFELNGVFAWLQFADYQASAFVPWFFLLFEFMYSAAQDDQPLKIQLPTILAGGLIAGAAVYSGFPEVVYLYSLLLIFWCIFRARSLSCRRSMLLGRNLALTGLVGIAISAPIFIAFVTFLRDATTGQHDSNGFYGVFLQPSTLLQYLLPYVYGPIFGGVPTLGGAIWGAIGGYTGFFPMVFAVAALLSSRRRATKLFLLCWIVVAIGVSHGLPGLYDAFMLLPLTKLAACFRYLNAGWIFCVVFLSALFIDDAASASSNELARWIRLAASGGVAVVVATMYLGRNWLSSSWNDTLATKIFLTATLSGLALSLIALLVVSFFKNPRRINQSLAFLLITEALIVYLVPYTAYPRSGQIDYKLLAWLKENIGYQRIVNTDQAGLGPNYGSMYGIAQLNYNDIPAAKPTAIYIKDKLDPFAHPVFYISQPVGISPEQQQERVKLMPTKLDAYAQAGVKYLLARDNYPAGKRVFTSSKTGISVYELSNVRPYLSAENCTLTTESRDALSAVCTQPSRLTRLELNLDGWTAKVSGVAVPIATVDDVFQSVELPQGTTTIKFSYAPRGFWLSFLVACTVLVLILGYFAWAGAQALIAASFTAKPTILQRIGNRLKKPPMAQPLI